MDVSRVRRGIMTSGDTRLWRALMLLAPLASIVASAAVLISMFDPGDVLLALQGADVGFIALAFSLGAVIEGASPARASAATS